MAYNYRRAEKKWLDWKQKEETQLWELGVDEDMIQRLHTYDWEQFRADRKFYRRTINAGEADLWRPRENDEVVSDVDSLLEGIEDSRLYQILENTNRKTLEMLSMRIKGYSCKQIAEMYGMQEMAVINRISRLRKKIKKIF